MRVLQAIGGAMLTPTSLALTLAAFPQEKRAIAVTLWAAAGALMLALVAGPQPQYLAVWLPAMLLTGLGVALVLPVLSSATVQELPPTKLAVGSGVNQAIRQFATVLGVSLVFALLGRVPDNVTVFDRVFMLMITGGGDRIPLAIAAEQAVQ